MKVKQQTSKQRRAPKGQKLLAQGSALGFVVSEKPRPVRAKELIDLRYVLELLPLQGE
jgi:hypothetical protein